MLGKQLAGAKAFAASRRFARIEHKNAVDFLNGLRVLVCGMRGRHDQLRLRAIHMRTPVRHDAIAGVRSVASAAVPHDGVIRDAGRDWDCVDRFHEPVVGREGIHAIGDPFELEVARLESGEFKTELPALSSVEGALTRLDPIRPSQLLARSLPRNGAEMKITRPISERCWKMSASVKIFLPSGESGTCSGGFLKSFIQSLSPVSVMSKRLMQPPML